MRLKSQICFALRHGARAFDCLKVVLVLLVLAAGIAQPAAAQLKPETEQLFRRIFVAKEFQSKVFGPARWLEGGAAYTTLEASGASKDLKDIVRYATASGERSVMVSATQLTPRGEKRRWRSPASAGPAAGHGC